MEESISAAEANRRFSALLRGVRDGSTYVITSHGRAVARIVPAGPVDDRAGARTALFKRLASVTVVDIGRWTRDDVYDDET